MTAIDEFFKKKLRMSISSDRNAKFNMPNFFVSYHEMLCTHGIL